jgi:hypothetical protein
MRDAAIAVREWLTPEGRVRKLCLGEYELNGRQAPRIRIHKYNERTHVRPRTTVVRTQATSAENDRRRTPTA